ncbi:hypothetical protein HBI56_123690 [Parastagonospora nodorum]|uniref:Uncharacterized protein n=1 Tax=Phaeosphaeria nodorum (strain SN15 / ATCC MYA-4574 / FGSC 10173) TaxID=321614 RepID=A0A7U2F8J5_PHANO|nr:hypothetical protein HBH56_164970 [Parastagonospora nodorum]QRC98450.1 hypothetical protein JI435_045130 [Parastagonospora nodorum SN15]KAH3936369.1 hypothetical protein HBH54_028060 [Parastagonospora nodorum]KAH3989759.1 hypothetical protein HBH52_015160 [Parastagonospora nodorum]KAH4017230.1 hypothetical protein HBI09_198510 [Parastagonospora nodorum]
MQDAKNATTSEVHDTDRFLLEVDEVSLENQKTSPLLRLPAEIRNAIYAYVLQGHRVCLDSSPKPFVGTDNKKGQVENLLSITKTCRQTYSESALMFFGLNDFGGANVMGGWNRKQPLFEKLKEPQLKAIKYWWCTHCHVDCARIVNAPLDRLPNVQRFTLFVDTTNKLATSRAGFKNMVDKLAGRDMEVVIELLEDYE